MASASTSDGRPERIGAYRLLRRLAVGGMAEVFEAIHDDGRRVALKVPLPEARRDGAYVAALRQEAELARRLHHEGVVSVTELVEDATQGDIALAMELVEGPTLERAMDPPPEPRPSVAAVLALVVDLLDALAYVHEAVDERGTPLRVVHRDLKPENLLLGRDGSIKLLDFGIARSRLSSTRTRTGTIKGTLRYLSPEQATGSEVDARTDLYAVGLLAYWLFTGSPYLDAPNDLELVKLAECPPVRAFPDDVPADAARTLTRCLAQFPELRPDSARAVADALRPFASPRDEARAVFARLAEPHLLEPMTTAPVAAASTRSRKAWSVALVISAAVASIVGFAWRSPRPSTPGRPVSARTASVERIESAPRAIEPPTATHTTDAGAGARPPRAAVSSGVRPRVPVEANTPSPPTPPPAPTASPPTATPVETGVTRASVRARLAAADAAIRDARDRGVDVTRLSGRSREALELYSEGQYERADALLSAILAEARSR